MKALVWHGKKDVRVESVPDPKILNPHDIIIGVTKTAICGSDIHLYDGYVPTMEAGDILGHEFMGIVVETGPEVKKIKKGDRVVIPFTIACGQCFFCSHQLWASCDNTNPNAEMAEKQFGFTPSGLFGFSHLLGGYAGGQAEFVRVPFGDVGAFIIPNHIQDERALFLTDILPTGYMAAENCNIQPGDTVAVWGCGPVGIFSMISAYLLGAEQVIAIDNVPGRLELAQQYAKARPLNFSEVDVYERLTALTKGRGPDACIDAVGLESHGVTFDAAMDRIKTGLYLTSDRAHVLREAIFCCRKGGTLSIPGVYGGFVDKIPFGAAHAKGLTFKMGQTHVHRYIPMLLEKIEANQIDPSYIISHRMKLSEAAAGYSLFANQRSECTKVVLTPD